MKERRSIVSHKSYINFQNRFGFIPASDLKDRHIIATRMLQGVYRGTKHESDYCNMLDHTEIDLSVNFMRHKRLEADAMAEINEIHGRNRLSDKKRLLYNLLSSQPLAFNLFLPLRWDNYQTATLVFEALFPDLQISKITRIKLEYFPGDDQLAQRKKIDNSCFDVYVEYLTGSNEKGGIGVEVKYTESFSQTNFNDLKDSDPRRKRYIREITTFNDQFSVKYGIDYLGPKYNQLFRNQLLTHSAMKNDPELKSCIQLVLHSANDTKCVEAIQGFDQLLKKKNEFRVLTIEDLISAIQERCNQEMQALYGAIYNRYCNYFLVNEYLNG